MNAGDRIVCARKSISRTMATRLTAQTAIFFFLIFLEIFCVKVTEGRGGATERERKMGRGAGGGVAVENNGTRRDALRETLC